MPPKPKDVAATKKNVLESAISDVAAAKVKSLTAADVLAALKDQGIDSLDSLVAKALKEINSDKQLGSRGSVARDTFIYEQFVYRVCMPISAQVISELGAKLKQ